MDRHTLYIINNENSEYPEPLVKELSKLFETQCRLTFDEANADAVVECISEGDDYRITLWIRKDLIDE